MVWTIEDSDFVETDLVAIFEHLFASHLHFGPADRDAARMAVQRVDAIAKTRKTLADAPHRGIRHDVSGQVYRHITIDRAIYWFTLDEVAQVLRIEAIFFGGQDHLGRMFARLTAEGEAH